VKRIDSPTNVAQYEGAPEDAAKEIVLKIADALRLVFLLAVVVAFNGCGGAGTGTIVPPVQYSVLLTWDASPSNVSGYNVYRSTVSGSSYTKINSSLVLATDYTDSTVQSGTTYYYVTTAVDSSGIESVYSNEASAVVP